MSDIFISYARADKKKAQSLTQVLEQKGWTVWWDRDIPAGTDFREIIQEALDASECVIVLWSKTSINSRWVKDEADEGHRRDVCIPVLIDDVRPPLGFRQFQTLRLTEWQGQRAHPQIEELCQAITRIVAPTPVQKSSEIVSDVDNQSDIEEPVLEQSIPEQEPGETESIEKPVQEQDLYEKELAEPTSTDSGVIKAFGDLVKASFGAAKSGHQYRKFQTAYKKMEEEVRKTSQGADPERIITCPACREALKAKDLRIHFDKHLTED